MPCRRATQCRPSSANDSRETMVLIAAPSRSRCSPKISSGSSTAVTTAPTSVTSIACRASPSERSSAEQPIPIPSSGNENEVIRK